MFRLVFWGYLAIGAVYLAWAMYGTMLLHQWKEVQAKVNKRDGLTVGPLRDALGDLALIVFVVHLWPLLLYYNIKNGGNDDD
jgi:hypothetical protein